MSPAQTAQENLQGQYAGAVSRFAAYAADVGVSSGLFLLGLSAASFAVTIITGRGITLDKGSLAVGIALALWLFIYFAYSWAAFGRTVGMALLGIQVTRHDGADIGCRRAVVRTLVFPLSLLFFGLGFAGILVQRDRRALHDIIAGTVVVYAWDARAARIRFLAHKRRVRAGATIDSHRIPPGG